MSFAKSALLVAALAGLAARAGGFEQAEQVRKR